MSNPQTDPADECAMVFVAGMIAIVLLVGISWVIMKVAT